MTKRSVLILLLLALFKPVFAQLVVNKLNNGSFYLSKGWKFQPGDNEAFADPNFDDSKWSRIDITKLQTKLPAAAQTGTGWLRLRIQVADPLKARATLDVYNVTPLKVYLNGALIAESREFFKYPLVLHLSGNKTDVLAFRYSHIPQLKYISKGSLSSPLFIAHFTNSGALSDQPGALDGNIVKAITVAGILILIGFLHLAFLAYNPAQKANLYFSLYAFLLASFYIVASMGELSLSAQSWYAYLFPANFLLYTGCMFGIKALYALFNFKPGWYYRALIVYSIIVFPFYVFGNFLDGNADILILWAVFITGIWLCLKAVRQKKRGAHILAAGFSIAFFFSVLYYTVTFFFSFAGVHWLYYLAEGAMYLCPPLGISFYLAREFSLDSKLLQVKLAEVETLSARTLAQEQEKQQLLALQNEMLEKQVAERTAELNNSLSDLRSAQSQLVQAEKMASLGELTAGIAHEIQNPLNFVNNFSEVNREMIDELKDELKAGNVADALGLADEIGQNEEKIKHHGRRADSIVKGMLEHSRSSTGIKEPTDLNKLADEYLRLAYHGLRSKDKSFNAALVTHFDETMPLINIIPQDIGRVLLNLFNNAFYAVKEKAKTADENYKPAIEADTVQQGDRVVISVKDNGTGIPNHVKDKIMQPFFTTKPTGQGTGLGLSLSYDIIVKGHGGTIDVKSVEGEGSTFIISLLIS